MLNLRKFLHLKSKFSLERTFIFYRTFYVIRKFFSFIRWFFPFFCNTFAFMFSNCKIKIYIETTKLAFFKKIFYIARAILDKVLQDIGHSHLTRLSASKIKILIFKISEIPSIKSIRRFVRWSESVKLGILT